MTRDTIRLTLKLHRIEVLAVLAGGTLLAIAAAVVALRLDAVGVPLACFAGDPSAISGAPVSCERPLGLFQEIERREASRLFLVMGLFPIAAGVLLGAPVVAREIERGTAALPWTLGGSRRKWIARRIAVLVPVLLLALVTMALAGDRLEASRLPMLDPWASFADGSNRGGVIVARGVLAFVVAVLAGLVLGRQIPALIAGVVLASVLVGAGAAVMDRWAERSAVVVPLTETSNADHLVRLRYRSPDGRIVTFDEAVAGQPPRPDLPPGSIDGDWLDRNFEQVALVIPGPRYLEYVALHDALLGAWAAVVLGSVLVVIAHRRAW